MRDDPGASNATIAGKLPARTRRGKKAVVVYLEMSTARELKVLAAENDTTLQALGVEAIRNLIERYREAG